MYFQNLKYNTILYNEFGQFLRSQKKNHPPMVQENLWHFRSLSIFFLCPSQTSSRVSVKGRFFLKGEEGHKTGEILPMPWKRKGLVIQAVLRNSFACKAVFVPTHHANMQKEHSCCAAAQDKLGLYFKLGRQLAGTRRVRHAVCVFLDWIFFNWGIGFCNFFLE